MKTAQLCKSLQYYAGVTIREWEIIRWANEGLLGEISRFKVSSPISKQRDYTDINFERAFLLVFISKVLNLPWTKFEIAKYLDTKDKTMDSEIRLAVDKLKHKGLPRFEHIMLEREAK